MGWITVSVFFPFKVPFAFSSAEGSQLLLSYWVPNPFVQRVSGPWVESIVLKNHRVEWSIAVSPV